MRSRISAWSLVVGLAMLGVFVVRGLAQDPLPSTPVPSDGSAPAPIASSVPAQASDMPQTPNGVEVMSRGPVHEAFASPATEPVPTNPVSKEPPKLIDEMPPSEKPEGGAVWIPGYWAWDDERRDFMWVSGTWRTPPPGKHWVAGYWKEDAGQWRWVAGFWTVADIQASGAHQVTYLPGPPAAPNAAPPGEPPSPDSFFVPGQYVWHDAGYVVINGAPVYRESGYVWMGGYWAHVQPGYVWVAAHYRWTPSGFVFIPGYWDLAISRRGFLYAPVYVNVGLVGPGFVYTPAYAVPPAVIIDAFWVRPCYCHYYFGDYYGTAYAGFGFESCAIYSRRCYDPIFAYAVYEHRADPRWASVQVNICVGRAAGQYACPPRTLVEQVRIASANTSPSASTATAGVSYRGPTLVASARIGEACGVRAVRLQNQERVEAVRHAVAVRNIAAERSIHEVRPANGVIAAPKTAAYHLPNAPPPGSRPGATAQPQHTPVNRKPPPPEKKRNEHDSRDSRESRDSR